jgi:SfnB family sulfur acquisition oxidoreductase
VTLPFAAARLLGSDAEAMEAASAFAALVAPGANDRDRGAAHPVAELEQLARTGLLAINIPRAYGGPGLSYAAAAEVYRIISAADPSLGQIPQNHFVYVEVLRAAGSEEQKHFFFGEVVRGARFGNAQTERGTRHAKAITATLVADGEGAYRLTARKFYCTGALSAQWIPVLALDEGGRSVAAFVERHAPGVEVLDDWAAIGQRATASGTVVLTKVRVPAAHVVPHWRIFERPQAWTPIANLPHVAIDVGIAEAALADAVEFVRNRSRPWYEAGIERAAADPLLLERFGRLATKVHAARALMEEAAAHLDALPEALDEEMAGLASLIVGEAKAYAGDVAVEVANELFTLAGASAADARHGLDRHWRNARTHTLHDPNRWRYHRLGEYFLNGRLPPNNRSN